MSRCQGAAASAAARMRAAKARALGEEVAGRKERDSQAEQAD